MKKSLLALTVCTAFSSVSGFAQDATSILQRSPGYQPIARSTRAVDADRAVQADQATQADYAPLAGTADYAPLSGRADYAPLAGSATSAITAGTAQQIDPSATIDISKVTGLPNCNAGQAIGTINGILTCITPASSAAGPMFSQYFERTNAGTGSFIIPSGVTRIRVHAIGGGASSSTTFGGGGGGYCKNETDVIAGDIITYTVGGPATASTLAKNGTEIARATPGVGPNPGNGTGCLVAYPGGTAMSGAPLAAGGYGGGGAGGQSGKGLNGVQGGFGSSGSSAGSIPGPFEGGPSGSAAGVPIPPSRGGGGSNYIAGDGVSPLVTQIGAPGAIWIQY